MKEEEVKHRVMELFHSKGYKILHCEGELTLSADTKVDFLAVKKKPKSNELEITIVETKGDTVDKRYTEQLRQQKDYAHYLYLAVDRAVKDKYLGGVEDQNTGLIEVYPHEAKIVLQPAKNSNPSKLTLTQEKIGDKKPLGIKELLEVIGSKINDKVKLILGLKYYDYPEFDESRKHISCSFFTGVALQDFSLMSNALLYMLNFSYNVASTNACTFYEVFKKEFTWKKLVAEYKKRNGKLPTITKRDVEALGSITQYPTQFRTCLETYIDTIFSHLPVDQIDLSTCDKAHYQFYFEPLKNVCFRPEEGFDTLYTRLQAVKYLGEHNLPWFLINLSLDTTGMLPIRVTEKVPITKPQMTVMKNLGLLNSELSGKKLVQEYRKKVKEIADSVGVSPKVIDIKLWWAQKDKFLQNKD